MSKDKEIIAKVEVVVPNIDEKEEVAEVVEVVQKVKPTDTVTLADKEGNEATTTELFYQKNKDSFKTIGLEPK